MKILSKHHHLRTTFYFLLSLAALLILFLPYTVAFSFRAHLLFLCFAVLLIFTPWANKRTPLATKRLPFIKALSLTFSLQIGLILAFYTLCHLTAITLPINIEPFPLFQVTMPILLLDWGLFPWGACTLIAVALSYKVYRQKQQGSMSVLLSPLLKNQVADDLSLTTDMCTKIGVTATLAFTLAFISMECVGLIATFFHWPIAFGLRLDVLLAIVVLLQWVKSAHFEDLLDKCVKHFPSPWPILIFLAIAMMGLWVIGLFIAWFSPRYTPLLSRSLDFVPTDWPGVWGAFSGIWWLGWCPLAAGLMAYVWRGYKIRTLILWTLLLPASAAIFQYSYPNWEISDTLTTSLFNLIPALLAATILMLLFLRSSVIPYVWKATLPTTQPHYGGNRKTFLKRFLQLVFIVMGFFWVGGLYVCGLLYFFVLFPTALFTLVVGMGIFKIIRTRGC
jgi:hypothetical protein